MSLNFYSKDPPQNYDNKVSKNHDRVFAASISTIGVLSIVFAAWPIFIWNVSTLPSLTAKIGGVPIPKGEVLSQTAQASDVQVAKDADGFTYFTTNYKPQGPRPKEFSLSIPKLKIENAITKIDTLNFYDNLSHFPGSALPGETGNAFITGHSVLPQFIDTKNYHTIFSKLPDLEVGDVINVNLDGQTYQYLVQYKKVVDPNDLSVLAPITKNGKNLTLMTCVPPGTSLMRMVVVTSLI